MRMIILGAGAMGSLFGARLALSGHDVTLIDVVEEHVAAIRRDGLVLEEDGACRTCAVTATTKPSEVQAGDFLIVLTKANKLLPALAEVPHLISGSGTTLILPNGLGCGQSAAQFVPADRLLHGATAAGAFLDGPGRVRFTVPGTTYFGPLEGVVPPTANVLAAALEAAGLPAEATGSVDEFIWTKLMVNIGYNAATAVTGVTNGELVRHRSGRRILEQAIREAMAVAAAKGIRLHYDDPVRFVVDLGLEVIGANQSSMLQDVLRGRETEVEWLNGAVASQGGALGVTTPVNNTLASLVKVMQDHYSSEDSSGKW